MTAFLSIAPKVAAFAILLRLFLVALATFKPAWVFLLVAASILSMTYGNIVAISQRNIKRLLAYSGIAQMGNVLIGLGRRDENGDRFHSVLPADLSVCEPRRLRGHHGDQQCDWQ